MAKGLKKCCYCGSLYTGTIIAGVLGIVLSIVTILLMFLTRVAFKTILLDWLSDTVVKIILTINLVMTILISLLLIVGAKKRNSMMMLPWVVLGFLLAIGLLVSVIYTAVELFIAEDNYNGGLWITVGLIYFFVYLYLWVVVASYYMQVREDEERGRYTKAPYKR